MSEPVRIDKWLWAARLMKTRALAAEAVSGGRVEVNGQRVKASKNVGPGDRIEISHGQGVKRVVDVLGTAERRGPAKEAVLLYAETEESIAAREAAAAMRKLAPPPGAQLGRRPTKRDRRKLEDTPGWRRGRS